VTICTLPELDHVSFPIVPQWDVSAKARGGEALLMRVRTTTTNTLLQRMGSILFFTGTPLMLPLSMKRGSNCRRAKKWWDNVQGSLPVHTLYVRMDLKVNTSLDLSHNTLTRAEEYIL
jgi:hypothetical protein